MKWARDDSQELQQGFFKYLVEAETLIATRNTLQQASSYYCVWDTRRYHSLLISVRQLSGFAIHNCLKSATSFIIRQLQSDQNSYLKTMTRDKHENLLHEKKKMFMKNLRTWDRRTMWFTPFVGVTSEKKPSCKIREFSKTSLQSDETEKKMASHCL